MDPKAALVGVLCVLFVALPLVLWIGGLILRAAVGLTNAVLGGGEPSDLDYYGGSVELRNGRYYPTTSRSGWVIPVPSSGRAMGIVFLCGVVDIVVRCAILIAAGAGSAIGAPAGNAGMEAPLAVLISFLVSIVVQVAMLSSLLPTTLGRACLVGLFQFLIGVLLGVLIVVVVVAFAVVRGGMH